MFVFSTDLPSAPGNPVAARNTDTSVVVFWGASKDVVHLVGYYIECSVVGTDVWVPCNNKPVKQTRLVKLEIFLGFWIHKSFKCKCQDELIAQLEKADSNIQTLKLTNIHCFCFRLKLQVRAFLCLIYCHHPSPLMLGMLTSLPNCLGKPGIWVKFLLNN